MKLERAQELYSDYAEGALSPALTQALEQHFEMDEAARDDYARFRRVYALLDLPLGGEAEAPAGFRARILERAAQEQARRETTLSGRATGTVTGWFFSVSRRKAFGGSLAALAAAAVLVAVVVHPTPHAGPGPDVSQSGLAIGMPPAANVDPPVIQKVDSQAGPDGNNYRLFHLHLPASIPAATVSAWTATGSTTDPAALADATPALQSQHLTSHQGVQIPIAPRQASPAGSTLNLLVQWTPDTVDAAHQPGSQVVFTPSGAGDPQAAAPANAAFLASMQAVAAHYGVTVVVDAGTVPSQLATADFSGSDPSSALRALAQPVGYDVQKIQPGDTFYVYRTR